MVDTRGPQDGDADSLSARLASSLGRTSPKSPREALRPESIPPPPTRSRAVRHPLVVVLNFGITAAIAGAVLIGGAVFTARYQFEQPGGFDTDHPIVVKAGASADDVADAIQNAGLGNRWIFIAGVRLAGTGNKLQAGEYLIPAHASLSDIAGKIAAGHVVAHRVTFPEGFTSQQIVDCLNAETTFINGYTGSMTPDQIAACRANTDGLTGSVASAPPEGSLSPDTYAFSKGDTRQSILDRMAADQARTVADVWSRRAPDLVLKTPQELVTLASIIEKETSRADERSRVAAVYVNRLRVNMRLEADPTVIYALFKGAKPTGYTLSRSDLQTKSAYNTYTASGLPPGPIANPGRAALEAAANPSRTRDLYFVADGNGGHAFAETFEDHQKNVARWRAVSDPSVTGSSPTLTPANVAVPVTGPAATGTGPKPAAGSPPAPQTRPATPAKP